MRNDYFANIAAVGMATEGKDLVVPKHVRPDDRVLPMGNCSKTQAQLKELFDDKESEQEELQAEIAKLRSYYQPFMRKLAPEIKNDRNKIALTEFDWREMTDRDRQDFLSVLQGDGQWERVQIPHYGPPVGKAETIYRRTFEMEKPCGQEKAVFLHFNGVDYSAKVYLNGYLLGIHEGLFAPFEFDCTNVLRQGSNTLVVCVENDFIQQGSVDSKTLEEHFGDKICAASGLGYDDPEIGWHHCPPAMGIYQDVYLEVRPRIYLNDLFVRPMVEEAAVEVFVEAGCCDVGEKNISFLLSVYGRNFEETVVENLEFVPETGREVGLGDTYTQTELIEKGLLDKAVRLQLQCGINYYKVKIPMGSFRFWEPDTPWLYEAQIRLLDEEGIIADAGTSIFGMRSFVMDITGEKKGMMYLNGRKIRLRGANTMGFEQLRVTRNDMDGLVEDILLVKAANMNFLRITQRPVQDIIYQYCDMLGLMIQTDLPMFGALRINKYEETLRQAREMEHLVRSHPCVIMDTYINEPFPNAYNAPHRNVSREQLLEFFEAADRLIHMENPDRVIKHVDGDYDPPSESLPDNHCYTSWYNGHGIDAGALYKGEWIPVKRGWYYACGEYGAEGLDALSVMRKYYPKQWLPETDDQEEGWSPDHIVRSQTGNFHYFFYETPKTLKGWIEKSQEYQAEATKWVTEAFRRDRDMVSTAIHLSIDAWPSGWMKALVDCDRNCKKGFYAYRDALTPVMVSLRTDRHTYFQGETVWTEVWICNDYDRELQDALLLYEVLLPDGTSASGCFTCQIAGCDVTYAGQIQMPAGTTEGSITVRCVLLDRDGKLLHKNSTQLGVYAVDAKREKMNLCALKSEGAAIQLVEELQGSVVPVEEADCILIDCIDVYREHRESLDAWVREGHKLVFYDLEPGTVEICGEKVTIQPSSMMPSHFVSRDTGHRWVDGFGEKAFRGWYEKAWDQITPIMESNFVQEQMRPVLTSGNTDEQGHWRKTMVAGEMDYGRGTVVLCQLKLAGRIRENPVAWIFAKRMFVK